MDAIAKLKMKLWFPQMSNNTKRVAKFIEYLAEKYRHANLKEKLPHTSVLKSLLFMWKETGAYQDKHIEKSLFIQLGTAATKKPLVFHTLAKQVLVLSSIPLLEHPQQPASLIHSRLERRNECKALLRQMLPRFHVTNSDK